MPRGYPGTGPTAKTTPETAKKPGRRPRATQPPQEEVAAPAEQPVAKPAKNGLTTSGLLEFIGNLPSVNGSWNNVSLTGQVDGQTIGAAWDGTEWRIFMQ